MQYIFVVLTYVIITYSGVAHAAGSSDVSEPKGGTEMVGVRKLVKMERYKDAITMLNKVISKQPKKN